MTRRLTQAAAERDGLARQVEAERRAREEAQDSLSRTEKEAARSRELEAQATDAVRLRRELGHAQELLQQRTHQVESASRSAHDAAAERERVRERLEVDNAKLNDDLAKARQEVSAQKRRIAELEQTREARDSEVRKHATEADAQRKARAEDSVELEKRHLAEVARLKGALVDMERRLEGLARAEAQAKRRVTELEKRAPGRGSGDELGRLQERVKGLETEIEDLRGENDFLNGEVARYHQRNKELAAQLEGKKG
jgi:chromosome segregation ATPase